MDFKKSLSRYVFGSIVFIFLVACDTEAPPEPLKILGVPSDKLYIDSEFRFELGASGGDGVYRYRYIQNPEDPDDRGDNFIFNPVEMTIENTDLSRNKPSFLLRALPSLPSGADLESFISQNLKFQIELTDGRNVVVQEYEFALLLNKLSISAGVNLINEGTSNNNSYNTLIRGRSAQLGNANLLQTVCRSIDERTFDKFEMDGRTIYPTTMAVRLLAPVTHRTVFKYRTESSYLESLPERSTLNLGFARPDVDYVDSIKTLVFEPGEQDCLIHVELFDDAIAEDSEILRLVFFELNSGFVSFGSLRQNIQIADNEPRIIYEPKKVSKNVNDVISVPVSVIRPHNLPITVNIRVDAEKTTALSSEFKLEPQSGIVTIPVGEFSSSYTVRLLESTEQNNSNQDSIISIITDVDEIINKSTEDSSYIININRWPLKGNIDNEVIATSSNLEKALDMTVDNGGLINVLVEKLNNGDVVTEVKSFNQNGSNFDTLNGGILTLKKENLNITPVSILSYEIGSVNNFVLIAEVNGLLSEGTNKHFGGKDFIVASYQREADQPYELTSINQYGSESDDDLSGAMLDNGELYIFGQTDGKIFDDVPSFEINNGGKDGFVYQIPLANNTKNWSRFIGGADDDAVVSVDAGRSEVVVLFTQKNTDLDARVKKISTITGLDKIGVNDNNISTVKDDLVTKVLFDQNDSAFRVLMDSDVIIPSGSPNPSLSKDIFILSFDAEGNTGAPIIFKTDQDDFAVDLKLFTKSEKLVLAGNTLGQFEGNTKKGSSGLDAFISIMEMDGSLIRTFQFGTPGEDKIIDIEEVNEHKFLVLWSENYSSGTGDVRYRISAFSADGEKLSPDPQ